MLVPNGLGVVAFKCNKHLTAAAAQISFFRIDNMKNNSEIISKNKKLITWKPKQNSASYKVITKMVIKKNNELLPKWVKKTSTKPPDEPNQKVLTVPETGKNFIT